jgi:hypothetical protein
MGQRVIGAMEGDRCAICHWVMIWAGLFVAVSSPAAAAPRAWPEGSTPVATVEDLVQGPHLVNSRIAWLDSTSECVRGCRGAVSDFTERERYRLRISHPSGKPRVLYSSTSKSGFGGGGDSFGSDVSFALSDSFLAIVATSEFDGQEESDFALRLEAGPRPRSVQDTTLQRITRCSGSGFDIEPGSALTLSGPLLAHDGAPCGENEAKPSQIALRDLATGERRLQQLPEDRVLRRLAASGRFVAASLERRSDFSNPDFQTDHVVALFDRDRPGTIATVPAGKFGPSFDVQSDGRVAICADDGRLTTFSPAQLEPRDLGTCGSAPSIASDRIVFRVPTGELQVSDLTGRRETIAELGDVGAFGFDSDGRNAVYGVNRCVGGTEILRTTVETRGRVKPYVKCPAFIRSRGRLAVRRKGRTRFELGCPRGCSGHFEMSGPRDVIASGFFERRPGRSTVRVLLSPDARRALVRHGRLRVTLEVAVDDRNGKRRQVTRALRLTR